MKTTLISLFLTSILLIGCGGGSKDSANATDTTNTVADAQQDSIRHTKEYIAQRIDTIYKYKDDSRFCSEKYLSLDAQASKLSHEMGYVYRDYEHWVMGQDIDPKWSYKIKEIRDIKEAEATVEMIIHNFKNQRVILNLVYECEQKSRRGGGRESRYAHLHPRLLQRKGGKEIRPEFRYIKIRGIDDLRHDLRVCAD